MVSFHFSSKPRNFLCWFRKRFQLIKVTFLSLFYNDFLSWSYVIDTVLEPGYWCVDTFAKALGPIFVIGDVVLTSAVVAIAYSVGLPYYWDNKGPYVTVPIVVLGQFFFVNVVFHYWKALTTHPGHIPASTASSILPVNFIVAFYILSYLSSFYTKLNSLSNNKKLMVIIFSRIKGMMTNQY